MDKTRIEFYCNDPELALVRAVPSVMDSVSFVLREKNPGGRAYHVTFVIDCPSRKSGRTVIANIRGWLRENDGIVLSDPNREVLYGDGRIWAQLIHGAFCMDDYPDYELIEKI